MGIVSDADFPCVCIKPSVAEELGFRPGDYLQISNSVRCTVIIRKLTECTDSKKMSDRLVYIDRQSVQYLNAEPNDKVLVSAADWPLDVP